MVGVAVNVTNVPAQMVLSASEDTIATDGVTLALTDVVMVVEVAVADVTQVSELVMTTFTTSLSVSVVVEKVEAVEEVGTSLTNH